MPPLSTIVPLAAPPSRTLLATCADRCAQACAARKDDLEATGEKARGLGLAPRGDVLDAAGKDARRDRQPAGINELDAASEQIGVLRIAARQDGLAGAGSDLAPVGDAAGGHDLARRNEVGREQFCPGAGENLAAAIQDNVLGDNLIGCHDLLLVACDVQPRSPVAEWSSL